MMNDKMLCSYVDGGDRPRFRISVSHFIGESGRQEYCKKSFFHLLFPLLYLHQYFSISSWNQSNLGHEYFQNYLHLAAVTKDTFSGDAIRSSPFLAVIIT